MSLTRFQCLPTVQGSNCSFWIFGMSISLFTSRSLNEKTLVLLNSYLAAIIICLNLILSPVTTMLEIFRTNRKFLAFAWDLGTCVSRYFQFCVLSFGLSSVTYIFTKILKPLQKSWRGQCIPIAIFLYDGLGGGMEFVSAKVNSFSLAFRFAQVWICA